MNGFGGVDIENDGKRIRIDCDYEIDAVYVESQCNLSDVLKGMIMLAHEY